MNPEDIQAFTRKQPFEPFVVHLTDGRSFQVKHPDTIALGRRTAVIINPPEEASDFIHCAFRHITNIDKLETTA